MDGVGSAGRGDRISYLVKRRITVHIDIVHELPAECLHFVQLVEHRFSVVLVWTRQNRTNAIFAVLDVILNLVVQKVRQVENFEVVYALTGVKIFAAVCEIIVEE